MKKTAQERKRIINDALNQINGNALFKSGIKMQVDCIIKDYEDRIKLLELIAEDLEKQLKEKDIKINSIKYHWRI